MSSQLTFEGFENAIDFALDRIRGAALPHANHTTFVREVAAKTLGNRHGSIILCAAPADVSCDELIREIEDELTAQSEAMTGNPFPGLSVVSVPSRLRRNRGASSLLEAYHHISGDNLLQHRRPPEFQLEFTPLCHRSPFHETSSMLRTRASAVYVWKNAHWLQPAGAPVDDAVDALATLAEIAEHSRRTHILIGDTATVLQWLKCAEIARHVCPCCLAPYDLVNEADAAGFTAVLDAYDSILPWDDGCCLADHLEAIDGIVHGCPHRLRKWLIQALCKTRAEREHSLSWSRFWSSRLLPCERTEAKREHDLYSDTIQEGEARANTCSSTRADVPKRNPKPGIRKPNRNGVAA
jgi:hypothetical protein